MIERVARAIFVRDDGPLNEDELAVATAASARLLFGVL